MTELFCTPEQGARLKELLPELEYSFVLIYNDGWHVGNAEDWPDYHPALTLQELRDVAFELTESKRIGKDEVGLWIEDWLMIHNDCTAPELADWVIARLEEQP